MKDADDLPFGRLCDLDGDGKLDPMEEMLVYDMMEEDRLRTKAYFEGVREERERDRRAREETRSLSFGAAPAKTKEKQPGPIRLPKSEDDYVSSWRSAYSGSRFLLILALFILVGIISAAPEFTSKEYGIVVLIGFFALFVDSLYEFSVSLEKEKKEFAELRGRYLATLDEAQRAALDKRMRKERLKKALRVTVWLVLGGALAVWFISSNY